MDPGVYPPPTLYTEDFPVPYWHARVLMAKRTEFLPSLDRTWVEVWGPETLAKLQFILIIKGCNLARENLKVLDTLLHMSYLSFKWSPFFLARDSNYLGKLFIDLLFRLLYHWQHGQELHGCPGGLRSHRKFPLWLWLRCHDRCDCFSQLFGILQHHANVFYYWCYKQYIFWWW